MVFIFDFVSLSVFRTWAFSVWRRRMWLRPSLAGCRPIITPSTVSSHGCRRAYSPWHFLWCCPFGSWCALSGETLQTSHSNVKTNIWGIHLYIQFMVWQGITMVKYCSHKYYFLPTLRWLLAWIHFISFTVLRFNTTFVSQPVPSSIVASMAE